jgi:MFS family permease
MFNTFKNGLKRYPRQFWLLFAGMLISTSGASMIWPFLMIYVSEKLEIGLTTATSLMTVNAVMGLVSAFVAGPLFDRIGRKWIMVVSLAANGLVFLIYSQAHTLPVFAITMAIAGSINPLYRIGADSMMADLIPPTDRPDAYALMRMASNIGVAIGPAVGGFIAVSSYNLAFYFASGGMIIYSLLLLVFATETLPKKVQSLDAAPKPVEKFGGYGEIFKDKPFTSFVGAFTLVQICSTMIWVLMAVYAKHYYGVPENQYGFIATTNAVMVVLFQVWVTRITKRHPPLSVLTLGALFYTIAVGSVALATGFWGFWISIVIMTTGELMLMPTSSSYAANLAPAEKRGRYMSLYGLTWGVASGIGPILGGFLSDSVSPKATWYGGALMGVVSIVTFLILRNRMKKVETKFSLPV